MTRIFITAIWIVLSLLGCVMNIHRPKVIFLNLTKKVILLKQVKIDPQIEIDVGRMLSCASIHCSKQGSCFRVAKFARDYLRELHEQIAKEEQQEEEQKKYFTNEIYGSVGTWEMP